MNRDHEEQLLAFGAAQYRHFREEDWLALAAAGPVTSDEVAATALFLAGGYWYGHADPLFRVAEQLAPGSVGKFSVWAKAVRFDCSRFDHMLKGRISREARRVEMKGVAEPALTPAGAPGGQVEPEPQS